MDYNRYKKLMEQIISELYEISDKIDLNDKWRIASALGISPQTVYNYTGGKKDYLPKIGLGEKILEQAHIIIKEKEKEKR